MLPDPMLAATGELRRDRVHAVEVKYDGCRGIVAWDGTRVRARSRPGSSMIGWFPELEAIAGDLEGRRVVLDGEVIAPDAEGRPDFHRLQTRIGHPPRRGSRPAPVRFVAFDVLGLDGRSLCDEPWRRRREVLERLGQAAGPSWTVAPSFDDVEAARDATARHGLEGVVVKDAAAPYRPGVRSRAWIKIKHTTVSRLVVGGLMATSRCRDALVVGELRDGRLHHRGVVEVSTSQGRRAEVAALLRTATRDRSPFVDPPGFRHVTWVEPLLVVEVRHLGHTSGGRLREPVLVAPVEVLPAP